MWFDDESMCPRMTLEEAMELGILEQSDVDFCKQWWKMPTLYCTHECIHDMFVRRQAMTVVRAGPVDPEDAVAWQENWEKLKEFNFDAIVKKYNVKFDRRENGPYMDWNWRTNEERDLTGRSDES